MLNISSRQFRITVGGLDVSSLVQYFEVGDDRVSSSGLISTKGTIKLRYNPKFNIGRNPKITLDPKIPESAGYWARGVSVKLWLNDSTQTERKHPRHSLRILSTTFDRNELSLVIEVGCLLALLDSQQPEGDESETCLNQRRSVDDVIRSLLTGGARDYPSVSITYLGFVPGYIETPQEKGSGGSYVGEAGTVAYGRGYALWVTKDEEIKAIKILPKDSLARIVLDADRDSFEYVRNDGQGSSGETPYDRVRVSYSVVTLTETETSYTQTTEEFGATENSGSGVVLVRRTQITDNLNFKASTREIVTKRWMRQSETMPWIFNFGDPTSEEYENPSDALILSEIVEELHQFEAVKDDADLTEACKDEGLNGFQGRLLSKTVKVYRVRGWIYAEWIEQHQLINVQPLLIKVEDDGLFEGIGGADSNVLIFTTETLELYSIDITTYKHLDQLTTLDKRINAQFNKVELVKKIETKSYLHRAVIYPKAWKYTRRSPNIPGGVTNSGGIIETWNRRLGATEWQHRLTERRPLGIAYRSACDARFKKAISADYDPDSIAGVEGARALAVSNVRRFSEQITAVRDEVTVSSTQTTPPAPEFIPERYSRTEETVIEEFPIVSVYSSGGTGKVKEITLDTPIERKADGTYQSPINPVDPLGSVGLRGLNDDLEQAQNIAETEALLVWGRFRSINLTYDLYDIWFDLPHLPLVRFDVFDRDRITDTTYKHSYIVDGWSNAVTLRECICSHDGLWMGTSLNVVPKTILIAASITPNSTYLEVAPLPYALQEGDPIVIDKKQSITTQNSSQGSSIIGLSVPLGLTVNAGEQILVGGFAYTVAVTANPGATSLILTTPLRSPVNTGQVGTVGTITTTTAYVPPGSTAIPVKATTNTTTLTPPTVTIDVETILPPASLPLVFNTKAIGRADITIIEAIPPINFDARAITRFPAGVYENIGTVVFPARAVATSEFTFKPAISFTARAIGLADFVEIVTIEARAIGSSDITFTPQLEFEVVAIGRSNFELKEITFESRAVARSEFDISAPSFIFSARAIAKASVEFVPIIEFESKAIAKSNIIISNKNGSFELIAVW